MRAVLPVLVVPFLIACPSPPEICRSGVDQVCERVFECQSDQVKASPQFQAAFGTDEGSCKDLLYANPLRPKQAQGVACADITTNLGRPELDDFVLSAASECKDKRADLTCEAYLAQLNDDSLAPAECAQRCK
jgi:hypothetical protein